MKVFTRGFTFVELLLVIGLISSLTAVSLPLIRSMSVAIERYSAIDSLVGFIAQAQTYSLSERDGLIWGVCVQETSVWLVSESCDLAHVYSQIDLFGGVQIVGDNAIFFDQRGEVTEDRTFTVVLHNKSTDVRVNQLGAIDVTIN